ncbi:MAG: sterol desaturase family protein [Cytophagaceae bacterium]|nr:sterol desaturase family protein [Cytophagaceae bacterium]MBK9934139.1 sterol desaturase family protein [Cytophagaceae bacterium]MBL0327531.1 sterol desaturase family protein [Cytophagaceae bacterium]
MNITTFFNENHKITHGLIFMIVFLICLNLEYLFGVSDKKVKFKNIRTNLMFILPGFVFQNILGLVFVKVLIWENLNHFGLLSYFNMHSTTQQLMISFIVLDFFYWLYHFLMHKYSVVWRFHAVHHSDKVLNVSTSLREHPVETTIRLSHYMLITWLLGPMVWLISLHQFVQILSKIIIHSNWRLPDNIDKYLSYLILTPNMHHVHHHEKQPYTDSNFGDLFSIWDRAFGTFQFLPKEKVIFGLDVEIFKENPQTLRFKELIKLPFGKQKLNN